MTIELFISIIFVIINLLGAVLVIKKRASGFIFYTIANTFWVGFNVKKGLDAEGGAEGLFAQAGLLIIFICLNVWGWIDWTFLKKEKQ